MDATTAHPIHHSNLQAGVAPDGTPILTTAKPTSATAVPVTSSTATGTGTGPDAIGTRAGLKGTGAGTGTTTATATKGTSASPTSATGVRQRISALGSSVDKATDHPAVRNVKVEAGRQVEGLRQQLGRFPLVVKAEQRTGVDRVALVAGGVLLYLLLIPLNLFGLALPTTQLLTFLPPSLLAIRTLEYPNEERTKTLLAYFVVFGFVQFAESLMAGFLERKIPQYYTVKLIFLAYLIHPKTKGARKIHQTVLAPLLARSQGLARGAEARTRASGLKGSSSTSSGGGVASSRVGTGAGSGTGSSYPSVPSTSTSARTGAHTPPSTTHTSDSSLGSSSGIRSQYPTQSHTQSQSQSHSQNPFATPTSTSSQHANFAPSHTSTSTGTTAGAGAGSGSGLAGIGSAAAGSVSPSAASFVPVAASSGQLPAGAAPANVHASLASSGAGADAYYSQAQAQTAAPPHPAVANPASVLASMGVGQGQSVHREI